MKIKITQIERKEKMIPFKMELTFEYEEQTLRELDALEQVIEENELDEIFVHTELIEAVILSLKRELKKQGIASIQRQKVQRKPPRKNKK